MNCPKPGCGAEMIETMDGSECVCIWACVFEPPQLRWEWRCGCGHREYSRMEIMVGPDHWLDRWKNANPSREPAESVLKEPIP
jgi:hypothetical protein